MSLLTGILLFCKQFTFEMFKKNETGPQCCLSFVESVMVLSPGGGGANLKVLIASVDICFLA